jgi:hypothetical protein
VDGLGTTFFRLAIERDLGEVALREGTALDRIEAGVLLAKIVKGLVDLFVGNGDFGLIGTQVFVSLDRDFGHNLESCLEAKRFAVLDVEIAYPRLRDGNQALFFGRLAEKAGNEGLDDLALNILRKALTNDGGRNMASAEPGKTGMLLILLNQRLGSASDFPGWNFDLYFPFSTLGGFGRTHFVPFTADLV